MKKLEYLTRLSPKSQIVLRKEFRVAMGIKPGGILRERLENRRVVIEPVDVKKEIEKIEKIAEMVSKKWPKGLSAVEAIREDRE